MFRLSLALFALALHPAVRKDPTGVYAILDRVVFEGDAAKPTAVQLWGTFAVGDTQHPDRTFAPVKGYMYFKANGAGDDARAEWQALKAAAGRKVVVGFTLRWLKPNPGRVRCAADKPANPDLYSVSKEGVIEAAPDRAISRETVKELMSGSATNATCEETK